MERLLEINDLHVSFDTYAGEVKAVRGVSLFLNQGETLGVVGESGCGKSVTFQTVMKLIPEPPGRLVAGQIQFNGNDITHFSGRKMQALRGSEMGMIFQDPMTSLNPTMMIGKQITDGIRKHKKVSRARAMARAVEMLDIVGVENPDRRVFQYPYEFSGGMRQRVMISIALASEPKLLIADEPTTALDVTIQAQILELMKQLQQEFKMSIVLITHDLGVVAGMADRIAVMYAGKIVETGSVYEIFENPKHPYTWGLLGSVPQINERNKGKLTAIPGYPPDLFAPPVGCSFAARCPYSMRVCYETQPQDFIGKDGHEAACWLLHPEAPKVVRKLAEVAA